MLGFTYKGRHSSEFGIVAKTSNRPIVPEQKSYYYETPYMDGEYDMTDNKLLYELKPNEQRSIASLTKNVRSLVRPCLPNNV